MIAPRCLLLSSDFPPARGGIGLIMHRLAAHMGGLRTEVMTPDSPGARQFDAEQPFAVRRTPSGAGHQASVAALNAKAIAAAVRLRPDVVLSGHIVTSPAAAAIGRMLRVPVVQYVYADEVRARPRLTRFAVRAADVTVALSRYARDRVVGLGVSEGRVRTIPPGVDLPPQRTIERNGRPTILTTARLQERYKGHDVMIRALPLILARVPDARWVVVGDGPLRPSLEFLASSQGVRGQIDFVGSTSFDEDATWFDRAHAFAMPSRLAPGGAGGEGFGIVYLEANAHGLPVVAGNVAGALDAVVDGVTGLLVDPTDHVAVADAITELLLDPERAEQLGRSGAERAKEFAWPTIAGQVEELILNVIRERA